MQYSIQAFSQTQFYYGLQPGYYDPSLTYFLDRDDAVATRTINGASAVRDLPVQSYTRLELSGGISYYDEGFENQQLEDYSNAYQEALYGQSAFNNGFAMPLTVALTRETTVFREYGPLAGHTFRAAYTVAPKVGDSLSRQTFDGDFRYYQRIATNGVAAFRFRGFNSTGDTPDYFYYGGNSELRGYDYLQFVGNKGFFANAELRFPLIEAMLTPIGVLGGVRAVVFAGIGGSSLFGRPTTTGFSSGQADAEIQLRDDIGRSRQPDHRLQPGPDHGHSHPDLRRTARHQRLPPRRRPRLLRPGARDVPPRLPDPLRLVVEDPVQQGLGRHRLLIPGRQLGVPQGPLPGLDRVRLLAER